MSCTHSDGTHLQVAAWWHISHLQRRPVGKDVIHLSKKNILSVAMDRNEFFVCNRSLGTKRFLQCGTNTSAFHTFLFLIQIIFSSWPVKSQSSLAKWITMDFHCTSKLSYWSIWVRVILVIVVSLKESTTADAPRAKPSRQEEMMSTTIGWCSDSGLDRQSDRQPVRLSTACCSSQAGTEPRALRREHSGTVHIKRVSRKHLNTKHSSWRQRYEKLIHQSTSRSSSL